MLVSMPLIEALRVYVEAADAQPKISEVSTGLRFEPGQEPGTDAEGLVRRQDGKHLQIRTGQPGANHDDGACQLAITFDLEAVHAVAKALEPSRQLLTVEPVVGPGSDGRRRGPENIGRLGGEPGQRQGAAVAQGGELISFNAKWQGRCGHAVWAPRKGRRRDCGRWENRICPCRPDAHHSSCR